MIFWSLEQKLAEMQGEKTELTNGRKTWIDILKFIAICGVLVDHTFGRLYDNVLINYSSLFAVPLFIFIGGYNAFFSEQRNTQSGFLNNYYRRIKQLLFSYALGTACVLIYNNSHHRLKMEEYCDALFHFSGSPPYYYVLVFLQLVLISKILFKFIKKMTSIHWSLQVLFSVAVFGFSVLFVWNTRTITGLYGSGKHLFGGVLFFIWYLGMLFAEKTEKASISKKQSLFVVIGSIALMVIWEIVTLKNISLISTALDNILDSFSSGYPLYFFIPAILLFVLIKNLNSLTEDVRNHIKDYVENVLGYIGRRSGYIFIFHFWIRDWFFFEDKWVDRIACFFMMLIVPIIIENTCTFLKKCISKMLLDDGNIGNSLSQ